MERSCGRRMVGLFCCLIGALAFLMVRVWELGQGEVLAQAAKQQSSYRLEVARTRGRIYDRELEPLTGGKVAYLAAVAPSPQGLEVLTPLVEPEQREELARRMEERKPFLIPVTSYAQGLPGIEIFPLEERYAQGLAPHLLGYVSGDGIGQSGIEAACQEELDAFGGSLWVRFQIDALGRVLGGSQGESPAEKSLPTGGVVLTLDRSLQQAAQQAMEDHGVEAGACVVMDVETGGILAAVSCPSFAPDNVAASLEEEDAPLLNRILQPYSVGSSFKLAVTAAALEEGISPLQRYQCLGGVEVDGQVFHCHNLAGHGEISLEEAIQKSCNAYFVQLAQQVGGEPIRRMAAALGFGSPCSLAEGIQGASGTLPAQEELVSGELANFSFGQGKLTATPLQITAMTAAIANGGRQVVPCLVMGMSEDGETLSWEAPDYASQQVMSQRTARILQALMISVVEEGSGTTAKPDQGGAGGKTASAQTGRMDPATGEEIVHAWFTGFYPAEDPRYAITVLVEGGESGTDRAAPVFQQIANAISQEN